MCIRDSSFYEYTALVPPVDLLKAGIASDERMVKIPVSYTHLDVYKRQVCKRDIGSIGTCIGVFGAPVSLSKN